MERLVASSDRTFWHDTKAHAFNLATVATVTTLTAATLVALSGTLSPVLLALAAISFFGRCVADASMDSMAERAIQIGSNRINSEPTGLRINGCVIFKGTILPISDYCQALGYRLNCHESSDLLDD